MKKAKKSFYWGCSIYVYLHLLNKVEEVKCKKEMTGRVMCISSSLSLSGVVFINFWVKRRSVLFGLMNILESHEALMASCSVMAFSCIFHDYPHRQRLHLRPCTFTCYKHSALTFLLATHGVKCWVYIWCVVYRTCQLLVLGLEFDHLVPLRGTCQELVSNEALKAGVVNFIHLVYSFISIFPHITQHFSK